MKRRLSAKDDGDGDYPLLSDVSPSVFSTARRKRVRHNSLERRLAHMTLGTPEEMDIWPKTTLPHLCDTLNVILPSSVEEPGTPVSEPVDMEVEPTLVTTDTFTTVPSSHGINDWESGQLDIQEVQISPAVLERLRRQTKCPPPLVPLPCQASQALVLYRAPRPPSPKPLEPTTPTVVAQEDDAMEVEYQ